MVRRNERMLVLFVLLCQVFLGDALVRAQTSVWPSERPPSPLAAREVRFPPYEIRVLENGLRVVVVLHHEQPVVSLRLLVGAGGAQDPQGKPGVASFLAQLLDQGTATRTAEAIADTIDSIGGGLGVGAGGDLSYANTIVMKDNFDFAMNLLSDIVRNPSLPREEIERQRQQIISSLRVSQEDPRYVAGMVFTRLVYGLHPYGQPHGGTLETVPLITRSDLEEFHQSYFVPNNSLLAIVGDVTAEEAFAGANATFGDWARKEIPRPQWIEPPDPTRRMIIIDKPGVVQTAIRVGHIGVPRKHPDFLPLELTMRILGGEGSNRLQQVLRSERGLTYAASAEIIAHRYNGDFMAEVETRSDATAEALRLMVDEFWRLKRERVSRGELGDTQAFLGGHFPLTIETPAAIASQVLNSLFYDLDLNELEMFVELIDSVKVEDVERVAKSYLKPDRLSIVMVGDASTFADDVKGVGFDQYELVPIDELDITSVDFLRVRR